MNISRFQQLEHLNESIKDCNSRIEMLKNNPPPFYKLFCKDEERLKKIKALERMRDYLNKKFHKIMNQINH